MATDSVRNFYLAVWSGRGTLTNKDAARHYAALVAGETPETFDQSVYAFGCALTRYYPEPDMMAEGEEDASPWACGLDVSGSHLIMALRPDRYVSAFPVILQLAEEHGLVCYDPQNTKVHLPPDRKPA